MIKNLLDAVLSSTFVSIYIVVAYHEMQVDELVATGRAHYGIVPGTFKTAEEVEKWIRNTFAYPLDSLHFEDLYVTYDGDVQKEWHE